PSLRLAPRGEPTGQVALPARGSGDLAAGRTRYLPGFGDDDVVEREVVAPPHGLPYLPEDTVGRPLARGDRAGPLGGHDDALLPVHHCRERGHPTLRHRRVRIRHGLLDILRVVVATGDDEQVLAP